MIENQRYIVEIGQKSLRIDCVFFLNTFIGRWLTDDQRKETDAQGKETDAHAILVAALPRLLIDFPSVI